MTEASDLRESFSEHLLHNWEMLVGMSRRIAGGLLDADDLLAEAVLATFVRWERGQGEIRHLNAYIIGAMRNQVKDELKSPRSRVQYVDRLDEVEADPDPSTDRAELVAEVGLLRQALAMLPADQRAVLVARYLDGRNPRELVRELQRSTAAISMLAGRAKSNLKRTMLRLLLERNARTEECRRAARRLPLVVGDAPPPRGALSDHYGECEHCRGVWARFRSFAVAASLGAALALGGIVLSKPSPAAADSGSMIGDEAAHGLVSGAHELVRRFVLASTAITAVATLGALAWTFMMQPSAPGSAFDLDASSRGDGVVSYDMRFETDALHAETPTVEIAAASPALRVDAPASWECVVRSGDVSCSGPADATSIDAAFAVTYGGAAVPAYRLVFRVGTPNGAKVLGTATGAGWGAEASRDQGVETSGGPHGE